MRKPTSCLAALAIPAVLVMALPAIASPVPVAAWGTLGSGPLQFDHPFGIACDGTFLYVADQHNERVQKLTTGGTFVSEWPVLPDPNLPLEPAHPTGITVSGDGTVYVVVHHLHRVDVFSDDGDPLGSFGGPGREPGRFVYPVAVATGPDGSVYVTDSGNGRVQKFTPTGTFVAAWGSPGSGPAQMSQPYGIVVSGDNRVFVSDAGNHRVRVFDDQGNPLATWGSYGPAPGQLYFPEGLVLDAAGHLIVCDTGNDRIQQFTPGGVLTDLWGGTGQGLGQFWTPSDIAADAAGDLYVAEWNNHRIQKFATASNHPPDCSNAAALTPTLWPPDHRMTPVTITGVTDPDGDPFTITATAVTQDEPITGEGTGPHCPDAAIAPDGSVLVRAERATMGGRTNGRLYRITFVARDARGGVSSGAVDVGVPHDFVTAPVVDDGQNVDALGPCPERTDDPEIREVRYEGMTAVVTFSLPGETDVSLSAFDVAGRRVAGLTDGRRPAGLQTAVWNLAGLPRGVYFLRLSAGSVSRARSVLIR